MVVGMHGPNYTGKGLSHGCRVVARAIVNEQTIHLHNFFGNNNIGGISPQVFVRISGGTQYTYRSIFIIQGRLNGKFIPGFELSLPF